MIAYPLVFLVVQKVVNKVQLKIVEKKEE